MLAHCLAKPGWASVDLLGIWWMGFRVRRIPRRPSKGPPASLFYMVGAGPSQGSPVGGRPRGAAEGEALP